MDPNDPSNSGNFLPMAQLLRHEEGDVFGGLQVKPRFVTVATQDPDESVYILARKDVITNLGWVFNFALLFSLPLIVFLAVRFFQLSLSSFMPILYFVFILIAYYALILFYGLINFTRWYYNIFIVTNKRIINYKFSPFARYEVAEASLSNIQDVTEVTSGFLPSIFDYGNLFIQTSGTFNKFEIQQVPRPTWLRNILIDLSKLTRSPEP